MAISYHDRDAVKRAACAVVSSYRQGPGRNATRISVAPVTPPIARTVNTPTLRRFPGGGLHNPMEPGMRGTVARSTSYEVADGGDGDAGLAGVTAGLIG